MHPWLRLFIAAVILAAGLVSFGQLGARSPDDLQDIARGRPGELFWFVLFAVVMATSLLAAARRAAAGLVRVKR